jgi:hypothetical protein
VAFCRQFINRSYLKHKLCGKHSYFIHSSQFMECALQYLSEHYTFTGPHERVMLTMPALSHTFASGRIVHAPYLLPFTCCGSCGVYRASRTRHVDDACLIAYFRQWADCTCTVLATVQLLRKLWCCRWRNKQELGAAATFGTISGCSSFSGRGTVLFCGQITASEDISKLRHDLYYKRQLGTSAVPPDADRLPRVCVGCT